MYIYVHAQTSGHNMHVPVGISENTLERQPAVHANGFWRRTKEISNTAL
jgi:hypothetical protein